MMVTTTMMMIHDNDGTDRVAAVVVCYLTFKRHFVELRLLQIPVKPNYTYMFFLFSSQSKIFCGTQQ